jgi:hypothetical protein
LDDLAKEVGLEPAQWEKWLSTPSDPKDRKAGAAELFKNPASVKTSGPLQTYTGRCVYYVPNTVLAYWGGDVGSLGRFWVNWGGEVQTLKSRGFNVVEETSERWTAAKFGQFIKGKTQEKTLHGVYLWGHGDTKGVLLDASRNGKPDSHLYKYDFTTWQSDQQYKLGLAALWACDSARGAGVCSSNGIFQGFVGILWPVKGLHSGKALKDLIPPGAQGTKK